MARSELLMTTRKRTLGIASCLGLISFVGILALVGGSHDRKPLGEGPLVQFEMTSAPDDLVRHFLDGHFGIINKVEALPKPVLKAYTEVGGSRAVLANPGKSFEATDVIRNPSLPRKRLIFAGVSGNKCFVHYEQGGLGHSFRVAFFELISSETMKPLWIGSCGPAKDIADLRSQMRRGCPP